MTNDELRALADALYFQGRYGHETERQAATRRVEERKRAATYLRAQADAQPVAWRCEVRGDGTDQKLGAVDWRHYHTTTSKREAKAFVARCGDGIEGRALPLYPHPAPAAPHYAMLDSHRRLVERAIQSAEHPSGMSTHDGKARIDASILHRMLTIIDSVPAAPQAEPKREPNPDEVICPACTHQFRAIPENVQAQLWAKHEPLSDEQIGEIQRAAYERAAQECDPHEDDDRIDRQIKREIAERIRALGRQLD